MYKKIISFTAIWSIIMAGALFAEGFNWEDVSDGNYGARVLLVNPKESKIVFSACSGGLFKSENSGKSWRRVLSVKGGSNRVNALAFSPSNLNLVYAATDKGLYRSKDSGERWEVIFRGKNSKENSCSAVLSTSQTIFTGTKAGLFISGDNGRNWNKQRGDLNNIEIFNIDAQLGQDKIIYLAASSGIFRSLNSGESWERVYVRYSHKNENEPVIDNEEARDEDSSAEAHFVKADLSNINCVYFSGTRGVYKSLDQGKTWDKVGEYGLLDRDVKMLCLWNGQGILGLTRRGIFLLQDERWKELSFDLSAGELDYLILDNKGNIYVAAEKGIFKAVPVNFARVSASPLVQEYLKREPEIRQVQQAAIKYAEVNPEKISQWRLLAAKKALLPKLNIGLARNSTDLWHWESGSSAIGQCGDDLLRRGKDSLDWDVTLSWDLGELIWNADQISIDSRSKLMVELRDDILDEVNKLYFERLRVQSELDNLPIEDRSKRFDKELKLEELTASLDSFTGGYYSEQSRLIIRDSP